MDERTIISISAAATSALLIISVGFILFIYFFHVYRRKRLEEKQIQELAFVDQLRTIQSEIKNETINTIGRELHDNIGQLLTLQKMQVSSMMKKYSGKELDEVRSVLMKLIKETKDLTSSLDSIVAESMSLNEMIQWEIDCINRISGISAEFSVEGESSDVSPDHELIVFRTIQEFLNNSMKHSRGDLYKVQLNYLPNAFVIKLSDNGIGFDSALAMSQGSGLRNMKERIGMLNGEMELISESGVGTMLTILIKKDEQ